MTGEKRSFGMHPNLLYDVIMRQAGTIQKALLEGVMNAIDAGATRCDLTLDGAHFVVEDNGHGIGTRDEIEAFFETFGTPHVEGDAKYGRFRMGRGQMMAFGRNIWRTRTFEMDVDVKAKGLAYDLIEHEEDFQGTRIKGDLYAPIAPSELERVKNEIRRFVAWSPVPVFLNGEQISKAPEQGKWTYEDEDAYYALSSDRTQMSVYNQGMLVNHFHADRFGMGGVIVTKGKIDVNFARNDIQQSCPIFKRINAYVRKAAGVVVEKKTKLTDAERAMLARDLIAGTIELDEPHKARVITDVQGRTWGLDKLMQIPDKYAGRLLVAQRGNKIAESAMLRGMAFAIDEATLERFNADSAPSFLDRVVGACHATGNARQQEGYKRGRTSPWQLRHLADTLSTKVKVITQAELDGMLNGGYVGLGEKDLKPDLRVLRDAIRSGIYTMVGTLNRVGYEDITFAYRKIHLGRSEVALAWTDGKDNIWFNVEHAQLLRKGYAGAHQIAMTLLHEMLHTGPDTGTHQHDHAFYQAFHDISGDELDPVGATAKKILQTFIQGTRARKGSVSATLLASEDMDHQMDQLRAAAAEEVEKAAHRLAMVEQATQEDPALAIPVAA